MSWCRDLAAGNLEDAEQNLNRAASIAKLALGATHALTADIYDMLGDTWLQLDEAERAEGGDVLLVISLLVLNCSWLAQCLYRLGCPAEFFLHSLQCM